MEGEKLLIIKRQINQKLRVCTQRQGLQVFNQYSQSSKTQELYNFCQKAKSLNQDLLKHIDQLADLQHQYFQTFQFVEVQLRNQTEELVEQCQRLKIQEKENHKQSQEIIEKLQQQVAQLRQHSICKQQEVANLKDFYIQQFNQQQNQVVQEITDTENKTQGLILQIETSFTTKLERQCSLFENQSKDLRQEIDFLKSELERVYDQKTQLIEQNSSLKAQNSTFQNRLDVFRSRTKNSSHKKLQPINQSEQNSLIQQYKQDSQFKNMRFQSNEKVRTFKDLFSQQNIEAFQKNQANGSFNMISELSKGRDNYFSSVIQLSDGYDKQNINFSNKAFMQLREQKNVKPFEVQTQDQSNNYNEEQKIYFDPYFAFFVLTVQCVKMNSAYFDQIADVKVEQQWEKLIKQRVGMNKWQQEIKKSISDKVGFQI